MNSGPMFKGSMPAFYDRYLGPIQFVPWAAETAARIGRLKPARLLETACGTGIVTLAMADASPGTQIVATDFSQPMLDFAAAKRPGAKIEWKMADAQALPFPDASFDMLVSQFGVMFFPDKAKAYAEARRVLKPGGQFLFTAWDKLEHNELPRVWSGDDRRVCSRTIGSHSWRAGLMGTTTFRQSSARCVRPASRASRPRP